MYIVTIKLDKNPNHDPRNKRTGPCPVNGEICTDMTGEHHTILMKGTSIEDVKDYFSGLGVHVTRIERTEIP